MCVFISVSIQCLLMDSKILQQCMKTLIVPICKNKNGENCAGNCRPVSLWNTISRLFEQFFYPTFHNLSLPLITSLAWSHYMTLTKCAFLFHHGIPYYRLVNKYTPVLLNGSKVFVITNHSQLLLKYITTCNVPISIVRLLVSW